MLFVIVYLWLENEILVKDSFTLVDETLMQDSTLDMATLMFLLIIPTSN